MNPDLVLAALDERSEPDGRLEPAADVPGNPPGDQVRDSPADYAI
jgi:hypothetical protein